MPALICIFADWLEKFLLGSDIPDLRANLIPHRVEELAPEAIWPFALIYEGSGSLLFY